MQQQKSEFSSTTEEVQKDLRTFADPDKAQFLQRFFKTGKGQYAENDLFLGITVPQTRTIVKKYKELPINEIVKLLRSHYHEDRLCAVLIMVEQFKKAAEEKRKILYDTYLANTKYINNWDLVDSSAPYIVGGYLADKPREVLIRLAKSDYLFDRRIAMLATFYDINKLGLSDEAFRIADLLIQDKEDLMHKAVGWMLREVGKRCSREALTTFLKPRYKTMPRTMLRYAIEHFSPEERQRYLHDLV